METLDLHEVRHQDVPRLVENFVLPKTMPVRIITGNSVRMQLLVKETLKPYDLRVEPENDWNLGSFIVREANQSIHRRSTNASNGA